MSVLGLGLGLGCLSAGVCSAGVRRGDGASSCGAQTPAHLHGHGGTVRCAKHVQHSNLQSRSLHPKCGTLKANRPAPSSPQSRESGHEARARAQGAGARRRRQRPPTTARGRPRCAERPQCLRWSGLAGALANEAAGQPAGQASWQQSTHTGLSKHRAAAQRPACTTATATATSPAPAAVAAAAAAAAAAASSRLGFSPASVANRICLRNPSASRVGRSASLTSASCAASSRCSSRLAAPKWAFRDSSCARSTARVPGRAAAQPASCSGVGAGRSTNRELRTPARASGRCQARAPPAPASASVQSSKTTNDLRQESRGGHTAGGRARLSTRRVWRRPRQVRRRLVFAAACAAAAAGAAAPAS